MHSQDDYLGDFAVVMTEKGVVAITDPSQIAIFNFLGGGSKRPSEISESLGITSSSLHFVLDKMTDSGIIVRSKPDESKKEVQYSRLAQKIVGSVRTDPKTFENEKSFSTRIEDYTGLSAISCMLERYASEIGLDLDKVRMNYAERLAAHFSDEIGQSSLEDAIQEVKRCFMANTGVKVSVFSLNPISLVLEGPADISFRSDMLAALIRHMIENATETSLRVSSLEDFSNESAARFKVTFERCEPEEQPYLNTSLPQLSDPAKFYVAEIDGRATLLMSDIQNRIVDCIYERPLCVADIMDATDMPRSTVSTNLLSMVEDGVASAFYSESGAVYYGLNCSLLMKRVRKVSRNSSAINEAIENASGDGCFLPGFMLYAISYLNELGFDTDFLMVVLGARYMRAVGQEGSKNFDSCFERMSDIAKMVGLKLDVTSIYPLTIGISKEADAIGASYAMTFVKGMAHQGLEIASSGIFVRMSESTPEGVKVSFKEMYPTLSTRPTDAYMPDDQAPLKKKSSSLRDALRIRSARSGGKPVRTVRYITGIAVAAFVAVVMILAMSGNGGNVADTQYSDITVDSSDIVLLDADGNVLSLPLSVESGKPVTFSVKCDYIVGTVSKGVATPLSSQYTVGDGMNSDGSYTITLTSDLNLTALKIFDADLSGASYKIYDYGSSVTEKYACTHTGYSPDEYSSLAGNMWISQWAWILVEVDDGRYLDFNDGANVYLTETAVLAWNDMPAVAAMPDDAVPVLFSDNMSVEIGGHYIDSEVYVPKDQKIKARFLSTDGSVTIELTSTDTQTPINLPLDNDRCFTFSVNQTSRLSYIESGIF